MSDWMEKAFGQLSPDRAFDLNKQLNQQDFEAKKEYAKALLEKEPFYLSLSKEFGLQALKWLFLINVGAIGAILAYIGASSEGGALSPFKPFLKTMWYFGGGIAAVILSSLAGYPRVAEKLSDHARGEMAAAARSTRGRGRYRVLQAEQPLDRQHATSGAARRCAQSVAIPLRCFQTAEGRFAMRLRPRMRALP